jgi:hydrogenase expression/formation protein HypE
MPTISLAHGSGGKLTHDFIKRVLLKKYGNPILNRLTDSAILKLGRKEDLAFTTDSFVVNPIIFKGGDIGKLAVCGTINDLAVCGALPIYISCSLIIEEGMKESLLEEIIDSMRREAKSVGVKIVTGDTKVVERGSADKIFINTSGIGIIKYKNRLSPCSIKIGDKIVINGPIADHGIAVLLAREELGFKTEVKSDCASLSKLILSILKKCSNVRFMRDPTRGGLATTMNEIASGMQFGIKLFEKNIPLNEPTKAACELLGLDPLYIGNEGKVVMVLPEKEAYKALKIMKRDKLGRKAAIIGEITKDFKGKVIVRTKVGGERIIDMLSKEALPRIC